MSRDRFWVRWGTRMQARYASWIARCTWSAHWEDPPYRTRAEAMDDAKIAGPSLVADRLGHILVCYDEAGAETQRWAKQVARWNARIDRGRR